MKLKKLYKIMAFILPVITMCSCGFQKDKLDEIVSDQNNQIIDTQINSDTTEPLDTTEQEKIVYFDLNKSNINAKFSKILNNTATFLHNHPDASVIIEGHTDPRGSEKYNIALGQRRADAIKMYLESKGIPSTQISIISYGSDKPAESGNTENAYSKNRRAVIVY
ncbi:MAG: peptidoglycan-associated lipoprotein Pal [Buchnera aphidicola (Meitanaphis microgallis)]